MSRLVVYIYEKVAEMRIGMAANIGLGFYGRIAELRSSPGGPCHVVIFGGTGPFAVRI